jgi:DNA-binding response OmpR family regulator
MPTILIVEDDPLIALGLCQTISDDLGIDPVVANSVATAERELRSRAVAFALLDVNLRGETSYDLARRLRDAGIPFVFTSGSSRRDVPRDLESAVFLSKPCRMQEVVKLVGRALPQGNSVSGRTG